MDFRKGDPFFLSNIIFPRSIIIGNWIKNAMIVQSSEQEYSISEHVRSIFPFTCIQFAVFQKFARSVEVQKNIFPFVF